MKITLGHGRVTIKELASICGEEARFFGGADEGEGFLYVVTDSREAVADSLFIATRGERADGNKYIRSAVENGCRCVLCSYVPEDAAQSGVAFCAVVLEDTVGALGLFAHAYSESDAKTVAVTGSVGKTTTKEMIYSVLSQIFKTHKSEGNYNSVIGMPMSMLAAPGDREISVVEMGMSTPGEIAKMSRIAPPDIAVITNIGSSHMEFFGSREKILEAKLEIISGMKEKKRGILLLNADDDLLCSLNTGYRQYFVSLKDNTPADAFASDIEIYDDRTTFNATVFGKEMTGLEIPVAGRHNVYAALYAMLCGTLCGLGGDEIRLGLSDFKNIAMRQNITRLSSGITLYEDCYNASPESMTAAIDTLCRLKVLKHGRAAALLGDMLELGEDSARMHREVGEYAATRGLDILCVFGKNADYIADGAKAAGMKSEYIFRFTHGETHEEIAHTVSKIVSGGDILLIKASRSMAAEKIVGLIS